MLTKYLHRLHDTIHSRGDIDIEALTYKKYSNRRGTIQGRVKFYDGSLFEFSEMVTLRGKQIKKIRYSYHYQTSEQNLIFRYDNADHHPHIPTYPHHKHVGSHIEPAFPPDLSDVLREIDQIIYGTD